MLDFSRCRLAPFAHQREDVEWLIARPFALIASEMRTGKSKIVIDAIQFLYGANIIDRVIIVAPAPVRDVWADKVLGELAKHLWDGLHSTVTEFHARTRTWIHQGTNESPLDIYVTNFEFLRSKNRLTQLLPLCGPKTMLVLDESSFVKNHAAAQTKACGTLRRACGRVVLLNGTPIYHNPMDLFSQGNLLHHSVLDCKFVTYFKARYAVQAPVIGAGGRALVSPYGKAVQKVVGWMNLEDLQRRFAPYTVRRLQKDCLDLPPKLDPVALTATLTPETWRAYKDMRDEMVVWLSTHDVAASSTAAIKALRLSQITSGFLGGVEDANIGPVDIGLLESLDYGEYTPENVEAAIESVSPTVCDGVQEIGREKLDVLLWFLEQALEREEHPKVAAWFRFRAEVFRAVDAVHKRFPQFEVATIVGGQKRSERLRALSLLKPETSPDAHIFVAGIEGTGSFGLDFTASHTCVTVSSGYSPGRSAQTLDRVYGPGQKEPIAYFDVVAVGPRGQKTIDHAILEARRAGQDVATWTSSAWVKALTEE